MNLTRLFIYIISALCLALSSCTGSEDALQPGELDNILVYNFPEGNEACDDIFVDIYDKYGVKIIYKNWTVKDFGRSWTNPQGGTLPNTTIIGHHFTKGEVDSITIVAEYLRDHIFPHMTEEGTKKLLYPYILLVNSYGSVTVDKTVDPYKYYYTYTEASDKPGLDFLLCSPYNPEKKTVFEGNEVSKHQLRCVLYWKTIIRLASLRKMLVAPENFLDGLDLQTKIVTSNASDKNYYLTRGFIDIVNTSGFGTPSKPSTISIPGDYAKDGGLAKLFDAYLALAMRYDEDEMNEKYGDYPLVMYRYNWVLDYMMELGIDLKSLAKKY